MLQHSYRNVQNMNELKKRHWKTKDFLSYKRNVYNNELHIVLHTGSLHINLFVSGQGWHHCVLMCNPVPPKPLIHAWSTHYSWLMRLPVTKLSMNRTGFIEVYVHDKFFLICRVCQMRFIHDSVTKKTFTNIPIYLHYNHINAGKQGFDFTAIFSFVDSSFCKPETRSCIHLFASLSSP